MYTLKLTTKSLQNYNQLKKYFYKIQYFLKQKNIIIKGNICQKNKNTIYTVLKSPHVNKKSREQFNFHYYKQTFYILHSNLFILLNFLIIFKKILPKNIILKSQIYKKCL